MSFCDTINDACLLLRVDEDDDDDTTWNDCVRGTACNKPSRRNTQPAKSRIVICVDETDMLLLLLYLKNTGTVSMLIMN